MNTVRVFFLLLLLMLIFQGFTVCFLKVGKVRAFLNIAQCFMWTVTLLRINDIDLCAAAEPLNTLRSPPLQIAPMIFSFISHESVDFYLWLVHCFIPKVSKNTLYMPIILDLKRHTESALKYKNNMIKKSFKFCNIPLKWLQVSVFLSTQLWYLKSYTL